MAGYSARSCLVGQYALHSSQTYGETGQEKTNPFLGRFFLSGDYDSFGYQGVSP
jgi:hypothetical protein